MATQQEYSDKLHTLLSSGFEKLPSFIEKIEEVAEFSVAELSGKLGGILAELERQHMGASAHLNALQAQQPTEAWDGHGELAFLLYHLHNPPPELRAEIDAIPALKLVWDALAQVAPQPAFTPSQFQSLQQTLAQGTDVHCNKWGDIYGAGPYEQLDIGWAWTLKNDLMNHLPKWLGHGCGIRKFVQQSWSQPVALQPGADGKVRIAVIGDWGSGAYKLSGLANPQGPALAVMDTLSQLAQQPDYVIHLGDTYYSGTGANRTPRNEESQNLVDVLSKYPGVAKPGRCFTLNSNHEMYGGAHGYFDTALAHPLFSSQKGCSYFALTFGDWVIAGIDSAYYDPSNLYMDGGLGGSSNPQYAFLQQMAQWKAGGKKVILMSHHTGISTDGSSLNNPLWSDVTQTGQLEPDYWYWGHTHLGMVYNAKAASGRMKTRCIGHSSMPFAVPPGMAQCANVDWYARTPLDASQQLHALAYTAPRATNGFAVLTLDVHGITEAFFNINNTSPVWP
jgi:hypothetical protein